MVRLLPVVLFAAIAVAAPVPAETDAAKMRRIYGVWSDPEGDAKNELDKDTLRITIPARELLVGTVPVINAGPIGSARLWREITGDFTAVARVSFPIRPKSQAQSDTDTPRIAGLVVWAADTEHIGVVRVEEYAKESQREAFRTVYTHASGLRTARADGPRQAGAGFARVTRAGQKITGSYSYEGKQWTVLDAWEVAWKNAAKVGVYAKNASADSLIVSFDQYTLTQPKK